MKDEREKKKKDKKKKSLRYTEILMTTPLISLEIS
jgi:hypothetical protein